MRLTCKGELLESAFVNPKRLNFGKISQRMPSKTLKAVLTQGDGGPIKPRIVSKDLKGLKATLNEIEEGKRYELEVTLLPPFLGKRFFKRLDIESGVKNAPDLRISITAAFLPRVAAEPYRLRMPKEPTPDWETRAKLVWDTEENPKIIDVSVNEPGLTARAEEKDGEQWIVLTLNDKYEKLITPRMITVKTDDSVSPSVRISISPHGRPIGRSPKQRALAEAKKRAASKTGSKKKTEQGVKTSSKEKKPSPAG